MVNLTELWLPILLSAVVVFIASSILHMVLTYHKNNYSKLPGEDKVLECLRNEGVGPGNYMFPHSTKMNDPETIEKQKKGPVGTINVLSSGAIAMGKYLLLWFIYCVVISILVAYLSGSTLPPKAEYLKVFRVAGCVAFVGYAVAQAQQSIWKGQLWSTTVKEMFDGLIYALLTAGVFGWLWPR